MRVGRRMVDVGEANSAREDHVAEQAAGGVVGGNLAGSEFGVVVGVRLVLEEAVDPSLQSRPRPVGRDRLAERRLG